jgi:SAM-dependent methyltransferase
MSVDWDRFARLYDDDYGHFTADLDLYLPFAERAGGPILEAMCGTGRVLLPLVEAGYEAVGLDISPAMVEVARNKLTEMKLARRGRVEVADIRSFQLPERFALALIAMNSFMHLETLDDQAAALHSIREHLQPDGLLIIDLFNPDPQELADDQGVLVHAKSFISRAGTEVQKWVLRRTDFAEQTHYVEFVYDEIGEDRLVHRDVLPFTMRWLYRFELEHLLARNGFAPEAWFGSYELDAYTGEGDRLIVIARLQGQH